MGNPLLYSVEDCEKVIGILTAEQPEKKEDIVYVGTATSYPARYLRHARLHDRKPMD